MTSELHLTSIEVAGSTVNIRRAGTGKPVVYLHDELSSEWNGFLDILSKQSTVLAIELPGFGNSPRPAHVELVEDLAFLVGDVLGEIDRGRALPIVGASLGGWIALEATIRTTHLVNRVVLIGSSGIQLNGEVPGDYFVMTPSERSALLFARADAEPKVDEDSWIRNTSMTARLVWQPRYHSPKLPHRLNRLRQPTLVLWGEHDRFLSTTYGAALAKALRAEFKTVPGSGHFPVWEAPGPTAEVVLDFLGASKQ